MQTSRSTVMVTGAAGNLGRAVADVFANSGANLVLLDMRREDLESRYGLEGDGRLFAPANLLPSQQVEQIPIRGPEE